MADTPNGSMAVPKKKRKKVFSRKLKLSVNGETKSFYDYTKQYAELYFPGIGRSTYRVPPLYFNHQNVVTRSNCQTSGETFSRPNKPLRPASSVRTNTGGSDAPSTDSSTNSRRSVQRITTSVPHLDVIMNASSSDDEPSQSKPEPRAGPVLALDEAVAQKAPQTDRSEEPADRDNHLKVLPNTNATCSKASQHKIMRPPENTLARRDKALSRMLDVFENLGRDLEELGEGGLFMVSGVSYENYLNRLPKKVVHSFDVPRPQDVATRGELDILILHPKSSVLLVQVKSVGENLTAWGASEAEAATAIKRVIIKAAGMTGRDEAVFKHVLQDLDPMPTFTKIVALPFVSRIEFDKAMAHKDDMTVNCRHFLTDMKILCKDEVEDGLAPCSTQSMIKHIPRPCEHAGGSHPQTGMLRWWRQLLQKAGQRLGMDHLKTIVGRVCGQLSSLLVQPDSKSRVEVRTLGQAVSEAAVRTAAAHLTPKHHDVLGKQEPLVVLEGPPGAGKTMVLRLKGLRWLEEGRIVVVVNFGPEKAGLPNAHALQDDMNKSLTDGAFPMAERLDLALCQTSEDALENTINNWINDFWSRSKSGDANEIGEKTEDSDDREGEWRKKINFIVDDAFLLTKMKTVLKILREHPCTESVWCSTSGFDEKNIHDLEGYSVTMLPQVVRCPPTVQALLMKLEKRDDWKAAYVTCSVDAGLPTNGPPLIFLHHQKHRPKIHRLKGRDSLRDPILDAPVAVMDKMVVKKDEAPDTENEKSHEIVFDGNPLNCLQCAEEVSSLIGNLIKGSAKPEFPSLFLSKKYSVETPKSRSPGVLQYRDVVIVTPLPRDFRDGKPRMHIEHDKLEAHWNSVSTSPFVVTLKDKGIPVMVVSSDGARDVAIQPDEPSVILTDAFFARSLERKVIIFVPLVTNEHVTNSSSPALKRKLNEHSEHTPQKNEADSLPNGDLIPDGETATGVIEATSSSPGQPAEKQINLQNSSDSDQTGHSGFASSSVVDESSRQTQSINPGNFHHLGIVRSEQGRAVPGSLYPPRLTVSRGGAVASRKQGGRERPVEVPTFPAGPAQDQAHDCEESSSVDGVVSKLSDLNKEALYRAAACCTAQFVLVVP